ncbi:tryptophan synthase subunit alpha [Planctomycetaceae bacterium SH139]
MSAVDELFKSLRASGQKALLPFVTAGDPDIAVTGEIVRAMSAAGAHLCEIGVPYSDPIADGPVIQASYQRALDNGFRLRQLFELGSDLTAGPQVVKLPLVTMVSYSIILRTGIENYVRQAVAAGYSGAIVPDLLVEESAETARVCREFDFSLIQLVTPTTPRERQRRIAELSTGFLYVVSVTGITGERSSIAGGLLDNVAWLREQTELPICIGFGISGPEQVRQLAPVADGLIVGSAFVRRIAAAAEDRASMLADITTFTQQLLEALDQPVTDNEVSN